MSLTKPEPKSTPQVERSLNRQVVLEEDEYTEALSHIIARDFFPSTLSQTNGEPERKRAKYDKDLSLDTFQARYTSEDNSSFTQILDEENRIRKEKWAWAWEAQKRVEKQQDKMIERRETMLIEFPSAVGVKEKFTIDFPKPAGLITEGSESDKTEQETEATTESLPLVLASETASKDIAPLDVMAPQKDTRSAGVDGWKFKV
jgi:protein DGCR14